MSERVVITGATGALGKLTAQEALVMTLAEEVRGQRITAHRPYS